MIYDHPFVGWIYRRSPLVLQNVLLSTYGLLQKWERESNTFQRIYSELKQTEKWSTGQLECLQYERLQLLIRHAYENVPFYRRIFDERMLKPSDIRTPIDLYKLPVLTKQDVRRNASDLRARNVSRRSFRIGRTGGSTGIPLKFLLDRERIIFDHALIYRHWSWAGYRPGDRVVVLRGLVLVPADEHRSTYWRYDWGENKIYLSGFHLSNSVMPIYLEKLLQWKPKFIAAYPSSLFTLARFMQHHNCRIQVQAVFTSSEALSQTERKVIEDRFACRVWDRYGTGERLAVTQQCEYGRYHQNSEFGIVHVDSPLGCPSPEENKGELVLTGLTNFSMPLIRYAIEDVTSLTKGGCLCGRRLPVTGPVEGRKDDVIVTAEGRLMPRAGLDQIHEFTHNIERCQLVQEEIGKVIVRIQPRPDFGMADTSEIIHQLRRRLGNNMTIDVQVVEKLELTPLGKQRFIVSHVAVNGPQRSLADPSEPI